MAHGLSRAYHFSLLKYGQDQIAVYSMGGRICDYGASNPWSRPDLGPEKRPRNRGEVALSDVEGSPRLQKKQYNTKSDSAEEGQRWGSCRNWPIVLVVVLVLEDAQIIEDEGRGRLWWGVPMSVFGNRGFFSRIRIAGAHPCATSGAAIVIMAVNLLRKPAEAGTPTPYMAVSRAVGVPPSGGLRP